MAMTYNDRVQQGFDALPAFRKADRSQFLPSQRVAQGFDAVNAPTAPTPTQYMAAAPLPFTASPPAPMNITPTATPPVMAQGVTPDAQPNPMGFFLRNALLQREAPGGEYLNPSVAQALARTG